MRPTPQQRIYWDGVCHTLPMEAGVYSVFAGEKLLYIGESDCLRIRVRFHNRLQEFLVYGADEVRFIKVGQFPMCGAIRRQMEAFLTWKWNPSLSRTPKRNYDGSIWVSSVQSTLSYAIQFETTLQRLREFS